MLVEVQSTALVPAPQISYLKHNEENKKGCIKTAILYKPVLAINGKRKRRNRAGDIGREQEREIEKQNR